MSKLLLGITTSNVYQELSRLGTRRHRMVINDEYLKLVTGHQFTPLPVPYSEDPAIARELLPLLDGLILSGGADLDPAGWQDGLTEDFGLNGFRTRAENCLLDRALELQLPVFGICRGLQQINVYFGGTLIEDLPGEFPDKPVHKQTLPGNIPTHDLIWQQGSWCAGVVPEEITPVNSFHHQAVSMPGDGVVITGRSPDGIVEAIECKTDSFMAAVQFHPERMPAAPGVINLMQGFHDVCEEFNRQKR